MRVLCVIALVAAPMCFGEGFISKLSTYGKVGHKRFTFTVTAADIAKTPACVRGARHPPLSRRQAQTIAHNVLRKYLGNTAEWRFRECLLFDTGDHRHWTYYVGFDRKYPNQASEIEPDQFNVPVLMDGTVVAPQVRD
jgi:hypothetical protein